MLERYIRVDGSVLDRENICALFWDEKVEDRLHVQFVGGQEHFFDGDSAKMVDQWYYPTEIQPGGWKDEE